MTAELQLDRLSGSISHYSVVTIVFFATYIVFQPPATVIVRYLGPRNFLSFIVVAWGAVMIGMGFADSYGTLAALRVVLGILEAGFFPSCVYLLSTWCMLSHWLDHISHTANPVFRYSLRRRKAVFLLLHSREFGLGMRWHPCLRLDATKRTRGPQWLAL